jgi:hypothetical protein
VDALRRNFPCVLRVLCGERFWMSWSFPLTGPCVYNHDGMKNVAVILIVTLSCLVACSKSSSPAASSVPAPSTPISPDAVQKKLQEYSGPGATDCGRFGVQATADQSKTAADCAMQASQSKHAFYVAYDMPGMAIGVAGNSDGRLFTVHSQGADSSAALTSGDCPSQLRVAGSGRVTCFAPGDMGSIGAGHTAIPPGAPNPHAMPRQQ